MLASAVFRIKRLLFPGTMKALAEYRKDSANLHQHIADLNRQIAALKQYEREAQGFGNRLREACVGLIRRSSADSYFECEFNGVRVLLPRDTLCLYTQCIHPRAGDPLLVLVETFHTNWLKSQLQTGDVFVDVGAARGAMTIPIASLQGVKVVAFEPNRTTCRVLKETLAKNGITGVEVSGAAVSDTTGTSTFVELPDDPTGNITWMPDASSLLTASLSQSKLGESYEAPLTTLDVFFADRSDRASVCAAKIDVEGFEIHVLRGAMQLLGETKPHLAIDIHTNPFGDGTTEAGCRAILSPLGYSFAREGHVMLCTPPAR